MNGIYKLQLREALEQQKGKGFGFPVQVASLFGLLGQRDEAFRWLNRAYREHSPDVLLLRSRPYFDPLREDPRFNDLLRHIGFPS